MKRLFFISLLFSLFAIVKAQIWVPVGGGLNYGGYVNSLYVYDSVLYAGGSFNSPGKNIAQWNGTKWDSLGSGIDNEVSAFSLYKGEVYVGGFFSKAGGQSAGSIAAWNGYTFTNAGINLEGGGVNCLQVYDSLLYIGGDGFDSVNHKTLITPGIVSWDGHIAEPLGTSYPYSDITSMTVYNARLCLGEQTEYSDNLMNWNNVNDSHFGNDFNVMNNTAYSIAQFALAADSNTLYTGGAFYGTNVILNNIAQWNGTRWLSLGSGINGVVYAVVTYKNFVFVGGDFDKAGGVAANNVAMWNGVSWSAIGNGLNGPVYALAIFDSNLYAGGYFTSPGNGIAELTGSLGVNALKNKYSVNVYPNPNNGNFTVTISNSEIVLESHPTIIIYNILGEKVYSSVLVNQSNVLDIGKPISGIYLYHIVLPGGDWIASGKLIIE